MAPVDNLLWFHTFDRNDPGGILDVVLTGPGPNPNPDTDTRADEGRLNINPAHVYAYLGRTIEAFGNRAIVVDQQAMSGWISPFDTGGLLNHIAPLQPLKDNEKAVFMNAFTWNTTALAERLSEYPAAAVASYIAGHRPSVSGPHAVLPVHSPTHDIWSAPDNNWRAWTWECRSTGLIQVGGSLQAWTCRPEEYASLLMDLAQRPDTDPAANQAPTAIAKYREGGVSALVAALNALQGVQ